MTKVKIGENWGLVNRFGNLISKVKYKKIEKFGRGLLLYNSDEEIEFLENSELLKLKQCRASETININKTPNPKNVIRYPNCKTKAL